MPFELTFSAAVPIIDRAQYINECCVGGDVVIEALLPVLRRHYGELDTGQEDWGWYAWFRAGAVRLAVDVFTDDPDAGAFRIRLTSRVSRFWFLDRVQDTLELDALRALVVAELATWSGSPVQAEHVEDQ